MKTLLLAKWQHFLLVSTLLSLSAYVLWACAGGDWDVSYESNYTPETFVADTSLKPFFYADLSFYYDINYDTEHNTRFNQSNTEEWQQYLGGSVKKAEVDYFLNTATTAVIEGVNSFLQGKTTSVPAAASKYSSLIANNVTNDKVKAFFRYLVYAKKSEGFAVQDAGDYWDYEEAQKNKPQASSYTALLSGLNVAFTDTQDMFVKQRYWFQLVRYYFNFNTPKAVQFFEQSQADFPQNTLYYRTMAYAAGAYYKQKDYSKANYYYSLVFAAGDKLKTVAHYSFHPQNETDWRKTLMLCKNNEEKATLWQMLGMFYADESRSIQEIYKINPQSPKTAILLTRLVNKLEIDSYENFPELDKDDPENYDANYYDEKEKKRIALVAAQKSKQIGEYLKWIAPITDSGKNSDAFLWNVSTGYLHFLAKNYAQANTYYAKADKQLPNTTLAKKQLRLLKLLANVGNLGKISEKNETDLLADLKWLYDQSQENDAKFRCTEAQHWVKNTLADKYAQQNDTLKAECFVSNTDFYTNNQQIEQLKTFFSKPNRTPFEQFCATMSEKKLADLWAFQAIQATFNDQIDDAVSKMQQANGVAKIKLLGNPFNSKIQDCHDCDHALPQKIIYTKLSFLQKMQEMKQKLATDDVFNNALLLGNAFYNITYYGNARVFYQDAVLGNGQSNTDNTLALKYYQIALQNATDNEQKAKCYYLMAKCQRNEWYNQTIYNNTENEFNYDKSAPDFIEWDGFKALKKYINTKYAQQVLKECGYFATINARK